MLPASSYVPVVASPSRAAIRYLPSPTALCPSTGRAIEVTRCAITRCREIMTPQLSIVKTRFAKASLRARCARHRSWRPPCQFPNGCVGHSATQCLRWSSSFPNGSRGPSSRLRQADPYCPGDPCSANLHGDPSTARWRSSTIRVHELSGISPQRTWLLVRPSFLQSGHLCGADPSIVVISPVPQV